MKFKIDLKIFIFLLLFILTKQIEIYAILMIFAFIHELGHLISGLLLGMKPEKIEIKPMGFSISFGIKTEDYNNKIKKANQLELKKIIVALAGPITNFIITFVVINIPINILKALNIIYANILIFLFNMLPIYPLDGGRICKGILHIYLGKEKANKYINNIAYITISILTVISSIAILYIKNIAIFLIIIYLWILVVNENKKYRMKKKIYEIIHQNY